MPSTASEPSALATREGKLTLALLCGVAFLDFVDVSIVTTTFSAGSERTKALGAWGATAGIGSAAGVFLGGVISDGPGWRWVFFVNLPVCLLALRATLRLIPAERGSARLANFDALGAVLATAGMLLLVYAIVETPH